MTFHYYMDTDSLYIDLAPAPSADSKEIADGPVLDIDEAGYIVGLDIQHAFQRLDLTALSAADLSYGCPPKSNF